MKIVVSAQSPTADSVVDPRFGRAACFLVFDATSGACQVVDNAAALSAAHGAGTSSAEAVARLGAHAVISGHVGPKAFAVLAAAGIRVYQAGAVSARAAVEALSRGELTEMHQPDAA
jgi:predicted Fe-Mo cluster-binding NifX family protein